MGNFDTLFAKYDRLFLFDTETTGLDFARDEIIEFAAIVVELKDGIPTVTEEYDELISLTPGNTIPLKIRFTEIPFFHCQRMTSWLYLKTNHTECW